MEFIKSIFLPSKMNRHRYNNAFVSVLIFFISAFILTIPASIRIEKEKNDLVDAFGISFLTDIPDTENTKAIMKLTEYGCSVTDGVLTCKNEDLIPQANDEEIVISYVVNVPQKNGQELEVTRNVYFVFDFFSGEPQYNIDERFDNLPREENTVNYLVLFQKDLILRRMQPPLDENGNPLIVLNRMVKFSYHGFSTNELGNTPAEAGDYLGRVFLNAYVPEFKNEQMINAIFVLIPMSLLIVTIVWLLSRSHGRLKSFKEYYNIASICMLPITIVFFMAFWFVPIMRHNEILFFVNTIFGVYYLFTVFRLNNLPEII